MAWNPRPLVRTVGAGHAFPAQGPGADRHLSSTPFERNRALQKVEDFIDDRFRGGAYDWSIASVDTGLRMLLPPTSNKAAIHEVIRTEHAPRLHLPDDRDHPLSVRPGPAFFERGEMWEKLTEARSNIDAIVAAIRAFAATSGKKIPLLLTGELLPSDIGLADMEVTKRITLLRNDLIREANASNVSPYILKRKESVPAIRRCTGWPGTRADASCRATTPPFRCGSSRPDPRPITRSATAPASRRRLSPRHRRALGEGAIRAAVSGWVHEPDGRAAG